MKAKARNKIRPTDADTVYRKVAFKLIPLLFAAYVVSYLDRVNIGFAKLSMQADLGLSDSAYGLGAGIFFVAYVLFQVPGNLVASRLGVRRWIAICMICWGIASASTMFVVSELSLFIARFILGATEAGFAPAVILYISCWFAPSRRASITALWFTAIAVSSAVGAPISSFILSEFATNETLASWQWLFLVEGIPSIALSILIFAVMDDSINDAKWLSSGEKKLLYYQLMIDERGIKGSTFTSFFDVRTLMLAIVNFTVLCGVYGISFWLPQLVKNTGISDLMGIGMFSAIPWIIAGVGMLPISRNSDRTGDRRRHLAACCLLGALGLGLTPILSSNSTALSMISLAAATLGVLAALPIFWTMPAALFAGTSTAAAIAVVNALGQLGGFTAPYIIGWLSDRTHSTAAGLYCIAAALLAGALLSLVLPREVDEP